MNGPGLSDLSNFNEMGYGHLTLDIVRKKCAETCKIFEALKWIFAKLMMRLSYLVF